MLTKSSLRRSGVPNCLVAASRRAAMLTFGLRYEASTLYDDPMAPSMAHPTWRPYPMRSLKPGMRRFSPGFLEYSWRRALRRRCAWITRKAASARSADSQIASRFGPLVLVFITSSTVTSLGNLNTTRKASPMFLLALPPWSATSMCTMFAMLLTYSMMDSCSTSVVSVNWRMSQKPKMATILRPGTIGLSSPPLRMFSAMISAPASPKPTASSEQILVMEFSKIFVSNCWVGSFGSTSTFWRASGFSLMSFTFFIMRSIGASTSSFASLLKDMAKYPRMMHTKMVRQSDRMALNTERERRLNLALLERKVLDSSSSSRSSFDGGRSGGSRKSLYEMFAILSE
mmetsp:Transcript_2370/g.8711  ORF Transcript_2370/g.8711 Transcript_2370/m.8711 type:complete len:343 (-) Transcript_2370:586-1614(-)